MDKIKLDDAQLEDLELDLLSIIENKFNFKFEDKDLQNLTNFEDLISIIIDKVNHENDNSCTSQQAFYKIRNSLADTDIFEANKLLPNTKLDDIFPKKNRLDLVRKFETKLGYKLDILEPNEKIVLVLVILMITSFFAIFFNFIIGLSGFFSSIFLFKVANKFGKTLKYKTIRELIDDTICENYLSIRKNRKTVNKIELRQVLLNWFAQNLDIEKEKLKFICFQ